MLQRIACQCFDTAGCAAACMRMLHAHSRCSLIDAPRRWKSVFAHAHGSHLNLLNSRNRMMETKGCKTRGPAHCTGAGSASAAINQPLQKKQIQVLRPGAFILSAVIPSSIRSAIHLHCDPLLRQLMHKSALRKHQSAAVGF